MPIRKHGGQWLVVVLCLMSFPLSAPAIVAADGLNACGFRLLRALTLPGGANPAISPASIGLAVGLAYLGSKGQTRAEIARVFGWDRNNDTTVEQFLSTLSRTAELSSDQFNFKVGNSLWLDQSFTLDSVYQRMVEQQLGAAVKAIHFSSSEAADEINHWISDRTAGQITDLIQPPLVPPLIIANAVYLKASWRNPFDPQESSVKPFHLPAGGTRQVTMMHVHAVFAYQKTAEWQAVALPYAGTDFVLRLILPKNGVSIDSVLEELSRSSFEAATGEKETPVDLGLPKFRTDYRVSLNDSLRGLGMHKAFQPNVADFSGITRSAGRLYLAKVAHQAVLQIDEAGTEAGAATGIRVPGAMPPGFSVELIFDRPFVYFIQEATSGTIWFAGALLEPQ